VLEKANIPTSREEVAEKTLVRLHSLGNQIFGLFPFSEYFDDWLVNLRDVLVDFEANPSIIADDQFMTERSQIVSNVERELEERRRKEAAHGGIMKDLLDNRSLIEQIDEQFATNKRDIEDRKNSEIKRISRDIQNLKEELDRLARIKTGIFRSMSKKTKIQKEAETTQKLNTARSELQITVKNFVAEQEKLENEHKKRRQPIIEKMQNLEKEIDNLEIDSSLETRRTACEALVNTINAFLQRKSLPPC
jgi:chromosome segregation ATPase